MIIPFIVSTSVERWLALEAFGDLDSEDRELVHDVDSSGNEDILEYVKISASQI